MPSKTRQERNRAYYLTKIKPARDAEKMQKPPPVRRFCAWCKKRDFLTRSWGGRPRLYCSPKCRTQASRFRAQS